MSDALTFVQGDDEWKRLRNLALTDLYWFCAAVLEYGERIPLREHAHRGLCRVVEGRTGHKAIDDAHVFRLELPRDWGKTSIVTQGRALQLICGDPNISILLLNEREENARDFLFSIKQHIMGNKMLRALFPEIIPTDFNDTVWSAKRINVQRSTMRKEPTVFVNGMGAALAGMHPDVIIVDDMISRDAMENARAGSWQIMNQTNRAINQLRPLISRQYEKWKIYFVGTRWWHGDSYDHINLAYGYNEKPTTYTLRIPLPGGERQTLTVDRVGDLVVFKRSAIENGRTTFPEKWSLEDLAKMRLVDEALFACNMMNNPSDESTATFKASWLQTHSWPDDHSILYTDTAGKKKYVALADLDVLFLVDPGGFAARQTEDRARAAVVVVGDDRAGMFHWLDIYNEKDTFVAAIKQIVAWVSRYHPRRIYVERAGQQAAFAQLLRVELKRAGHDTIVDDTTLKPGVTQKEVRILALEPYFQRGQYTVGSGPAFHSFREQYTQFPRTKLIDVLDVMAYLPRIVKPRVGVSQSRDVQARQDAERAAYRARRFG